MPIIEVDHVTKEFELGQLRTLRQSVADLGARLRGGGVAERAPFKALDDVDFRVEPGEVVGIIGHNGAGKSTLLKLLARITKPTRGHVAVRGKVAPLIEVGAGLVPDLTGRENIFVNGAILGMRKAEIARKFDEIVAFAELEEFVDTPVKRYSSGMQVRLGFAIATSVNAEILIVDEVLAVGDLAFQRRCFDRMEELIVRQSKTVLLVSHNIRQIERICSRVMLLDRGRVVASGSPAEVCLEFYKRSNQKIVEHAVKSSSLARVASSGELKLLGIDVLDERGQATPSVTSRGPLRVRLRFELLTALEQPEFVVGVHTTDFVYLTAGSTVTFPDRPSFGAGVHEVEYSVSTLPLVAGPYCIRFSCFDRNRRSIFEGDSLKVFEVVEPEGVPSGQGYRTLNLPTAWTMAGRVFDAPVFTLG